MLHEGDDDSVYNQVYPVRKNAQFPVIDIASDMAIWQAIHISNAIPGKSNANT